MVLLVKVFSFLLVQIWKLLVIFRSFRIFITYIDTLISIGPAGALIAYAIIGFIVFWVTFSLGEMATYIPVCISTLRLMFIYFN